MIRYKNLSRKSNVKAYVLYDDRIDVLFNDYVQYTYSYNIAGKQAVEEMKCLAQQGEGLNSYINLHVRKKYDPESIKHINRCTITDR